MGGGGLGGLAPPEALTFNEIKNQWNTSDPPPQIPDEIYDPPPALRDFYFHPPPQYITKKNSDPPLNITAPPPPHLVINDSSLIYTTYDP